MHTTEFDEPVSTAPSVPQALNRYAATSLGQPGVAQAVAGQSLLANIALNAAGNTPSAVVVSFADPTFLYSPIIKGNKTNLLKAVRDAKIASALGDEVVNTINGKLRGKTLKQLGVNYGHVFDYASDNFVSQVDSPTNIKVGTAILGWRKGSPNWRNFIHANGLRIGVGIDVGVSALFEIGAPYWSNPYLSRGQKIGQLSFKVAGFAGASVAT